MTTRNLSENARRREDELQEQTREAGGSGWEIGPNGQPRRIRANNETPYDELLRDAPTADELTPELFLESGGGDGPLSLAGIAKADEQWVGFQETTQDALDLLMQQVNNDSSGVIGAGQHAGMQMADLGAAGAQRQAGDMADARAYGSGTQGSGMALQGELAGMSGVNDALLHNYTSVYNGGEDQALDTLSRLGTESGALRGQTFGESFQRGSAVDAFNQHNLGFNRGVNQRNTDRRSQHSADEEAANQQMEDNEYNLHMGAAPIRQAQQDIERQRAEDNDGNQQAYDATIGTIKNIVG